MGMMRIGSRVCLIRTSAVPPRRSVTIPLKPLPDLPMTMRFRSDSERWSMRAFTVCSASIWLLEIFDSEVWQSAIPARRFQRPQRVINSQGKVSTRTNSEGHCVQRVLLEEEGIEFIGDKIDLNEYRWDSVD